MQNRLAIASVVLIVLLGLTVWKMNARDAEVAPKSAVEVELPKFERDQIDELELSAPERETVKLVKKGDSWRLSVPVDAEADENAIKTALDKLAELEVTGVAATNNKNHARLEVDKEKGAHVIARGGGKVLLDAWIGRYQTGNTMLRLDGQDAVATVSGSIRFAFNKRVREWRDRRITDLEKTDVTEIAFESDNGRFRFVKEGDAWQQALEGGDKPIEKYDPSKVDSIVGTAAKLSATDFPAEEVTAEAAGVGDSPVGTVTLRTGGDAGVESVVYRIGNKVDNNHYLVREGNPQTYLVSSWVAGRLTPKADAFQKADPPPEPAAKAPGAPGSRTNPIPVAPKQIVPGHP